MWIELLKLIGPSALIAVFLTYYYNKKLERHKMLLKGYEIVREQFLSSLVKGLSLLMEDYKNLINKVEALKKNLKTGRFVDSDIDDIESLRDIYLNTLRTNRVFLTALIPYGGTRSDHHSFDDINLIGINLLLKLLKKRQKSNPETIHKHRAEISRCIEYIDLSYKSVCNRANQIIMHLQDGKNPYGIRWDRFSYPEWEAIAYDIHMENLFLDINEDESDPALNA